jgi:hypothetical protein
MDAIEELRKELLDLQGHQLAQGFVIAALLTQAPPQDVERVFATAEVYLLHSNLPKEVAAGARAEILALRSTYRSS